jgi:hypothetical protein
VNESVLLTTIQHEIRQHDFSHLHRSTALEPPKAAKALSCRAAQPCRALRFPCLIEVMRITVWTPNRRLQRIYVRP